MENLAYSYHEILTILQLFGFMFSEDIRFSLSSNKWYDCGDTNKKPVF